jgi:CRISPR/Cas system-associated exonuclease Cas4 (RecB family)
MARNIVQGLKFNKVKGAEVDGNKLAAALEEAYLLQRRPSKFTKKQTFSPSSIGYGNATCARYWYIAFEGAMFEENGDALGIANMAYGTEAHKRIQRLFRDAGLLLAEEIEITLTDPPIRGYMDVMIKWDGEEVPGEIKTTRGEMFAMRQASMKPPAYNLYQMLIYMHATNKKHGFLMYENKNDQSFLVIPVTMDEANKKILEDALEWLRTTRAAWESKELPNRPVPTRRNKICKECPVRNTCWDTLPEGENIIPLMEVVKP